MDPARDKRIWLGLLLCTVAVAAWGIWLILEPSAFVGTRRGQFREPEHAQIFGVGTAVCFFVLLIRGVLMYRASRRR